MLQESMYINLEKHDLNRHVEQINLTLMRALASINFVNFENSSLLKNFFERAY